MSRRSDISNERIYYAKMISAKRGCDMNLLSEVMTDIDNDSDISHPSYDKFKRMYEQAYKEITEGRRESER